jgi:hypothetical protein
MLFSCKISSAVISYLESQNEDISSLLENTSLSKEFLCDPSYWMDAADMEKFLEEAQKASQEDEVLFGKVGHAGPNLRSWGVLDSVLRMMPKPQEIMNQPQKFLSYFISPEPPVEQVVRMDSAIEFDVPVSSESYPLVTEYLKAAFESLPLYVGQPLAHCEWDEIHLRFSWVQSQTEILGQELGHQISPELLKSVVASLEASQKELEEKNRELREKNEELEKFQRHLKTQGALPKLEFIEDESIHVLKNNFSKLSDYMVRAQQLVTFLVGQDRMDRSVQTAMKKIGWDTVKAQFPTTVSESQALLEKTSQLGARGKIQENTHNV